jgi:dolichol-phosphate mannosyltransferase
MKAEKQAVPGEAEPGRNQEKVLLTLVVPTRNETENVPKLVRELRESLSDLDYRVVFVDDSTDETPEVIQGLSEHDDRIRLVRREGAERYGGLSTAVTTGIELFSSASEYTCLQHPRRSVPWTTDGTRRCLRDQR